ncbi:hypothetical protein D3C81_1834160 [compost metagenome]
MLTRVTLAIWLLAPAPWFTPRIPLPLLKEVPPMDALASMEREAGVSIFCMTLVLAWDSVPIATALTLVCCI